MAINNRDRRIVVAPRKSRCMNVLSFNSSVDCDEDELEPEDAGAAPDDNSVADLTRDKELPEATRFMDPKEEDRFMLVSKEAKSLLD